MPKTFMAHHKGKNILLYGASELDADMLYATRLMCPDPFIFIRTAAGRRYVIMSDLEIDRARRQSSAHAVWSLSAIDRETRQRIRRAPEIADNLVTALGKLGIPSVAVPQRFPAGVMDALRKRRVRVQVLPDPLFPERIQKTAAEVDHIRRAVRATESGIRAAIATLRETDVRRGFLVHRGKRLTAETLRGIINTTVMRLGYLPANTIVAPGVQGCDPHERGSGPIRVGVPVIIDVFPRHENTGYFGDVTRTVVRGQASDELRRMYRAVLNAQREALDSIRAGVRARDIHGGIHSRFAHLGFETGKANGRMQGFFHGTGHGLGLDIHEPPRIGANTTRLEKGMVVTVEPGLYYSHIGGVRIEDTVLVTRTGIENLTRLPKKLEI